MLSDVRGIVLRSYKSGEEGLVCEVLTAGRGRVSFFSRRPRRGGHGRLSSYQPLSLVEISYDHREGCGLQRMGAVSVWHPYRSLHTDPVKITVGLFVAEFLCHATRCSESDAGLYSYAEAALMWLDEAVAGVANFHIAFMLKMARFIGIGPVADGYRDGACFDLREGVFTMGIPMHGDHIGSEEARALHSLLRMDFAGLHLFKMSRSDRSRITEVALQFYRLHLPGFPRLKSAEVLSGLYE